MTSAAAPAWAVHALSSVYDPCCEEKGISVVDMGLLRSVTVADGHARVELLLTSGWCPFAARVLTAVDLTLLDDGVDIRATVRTADRTGVEMEALTAVSVAALTVVDMVKAVDKGAVITDVRVEEKLGGKSGTWRRE